MRAYGIGDLHLDGKLSKYIPSLNEVIISEVLSVVRKAEANGVNLIFLYGDVCDVSSMSDDAHIRLMDVFLLHPHIKFIIIKGNHDVLDAEGCSLLLLKHLCDRKVLPNVKIILHPTLLFANSDTPVNCLPWPHKDTRKDCLNVMHTEAEGTTWETGRAVKTGFNTMHLCVVGHIHKAQVVRNTHFSGTLYQVSFGEPAEKFFHDIKWTGNIKTSTVNLVPHKPRYTLINKIVNKQSDIDEIDDDPNNLYKVFVKKSVVLAPGAFNNKPNIIKTNYFKSKDELNALIVEELILDDVSSEIIVRHEEVLDGWMSNHKIDKALAKRVKDKLAQFTLQAKAQA